MTPLDLARVSKRAYRDYTLRDRKAGVEALLERSDGTLVIAFRGTEKDNADILTDIRWIPWHDREIGWCHSGFLKTVRNSTIWPALVKEITAFTGTDVYWTGHSLGAARATIGAALMAKRIRPPKALVTFGSPRVGFTLRRALADVRCLRFVNGNDVVTHVPRAFIGYRHLDPVERSDADAGRFKDHRIADYLSWLDGDEIGCMTI